MERFEFTPKGVCARHISFAIDDGRLYNVRFEGGCNGNLSAIGKLVEGMEASEVVRLLKGNDCAGKGTSCADQLTRAIEFSMASSE